MVCKGVINLLWTTDRSSEIFSSLFFFAVTQLSFFSIPYTDTNTTLRMYIKNVLLNAIPKAWSVYGLHINIVLTIKIWRNYFFFYIQIDNILNLYVNWIWRACLSHNHIKKNQWMRRRYFYCYQISMCL